MKRIFYYSGFRLTVFHWLNGELVDSYAFNPAENGLEKFKTYLLATVNTPARLLVDLIEEDFNKESIPHVGAMDRRSIVSRLVERQYRKSRDYFSSSVIGREQSGRRDDILLYSVLSNPDILKPWLQLIRETETSISGIWSLPLLAHRLIKKLNIQSSNVILVTQQVPSNLRQSFFKDRRFETSRSAVVNLDEAGIGEYISSEVEQTIRFLSNQRQIGFDEKVDIHIICREADFTEIQSHCVSSNLLQYHLHDISQVDTLLQLNSHEPDYCNAIFSYICENEKIPVGHYGNHSLFHTFYESIASKILHAASALIILLSIVFSFAYYSDAIILDNESAVLKDKSNQIRITYRKNLAHLEKKLIQSTMIESSVKFVDKVTASNATSPLNFMTDVSHLLTNAKINNTKITNIHWQQNQGKSFPTSQSNIQSQLIDYGNTSDITQFATIGGFIRVSQSSLRHSVETTNSIANAFKQHKDTLDIIIEHIPVDIRPESSIENESKTTGSNDYTTDQLKGKFKLKVLMQGHTSS